MPNYGTERRQGFVVQIDRVIVDRDGVPHEHRSYWYGPDHGFGTTWAMLGYSTAVFPSRPAARRAFETIRPWSADLKARRVTDVEHELEGAGYTYDARDAQWKKGTP